MKKYQCTKCDYIYDPSVGCADDDINMDVPFEAEPDEVFYDHDKIAIPPGTSFHDISENWCCPKCGAPKKTFHCKE